MSATGTPCEIAFASSTSTNNCGTVGRKKVLIPVKRFSAFKASIKLPTTADKCNGLESLRLCTYISKPPELPKPRIAGGLKAMAMPSGCCIPIPNNLPTISVAVVSR